MPDRGDVPLESRRPLTRRETIELAVRQGGKCGCGCGEKLDALREGCIDEHVLALILGGTNDLDNRALWRKPCAVAKTKGDRSADAKVKRLRGETKAQPGKPIPQRVNAWPPKGSRKLGGYGAKRNEQKGSTYQTGETGDA